jgi:hypothetical protein
MAPATEVQRANREPQLLMLPWIDMSLMSERMLQVTDYEISESPQWRFRQLMLLINCQKCLCGYRRLPLVQICIFMIFASQVPLYIISFQKAGDFLKSIETYFKQCCLTQNG